MKAILVKKPGGPEQLLLDELEEPRPGRGQALVQIRAIGVNFADCMCRRASHSGMPAPPLVVGCEAAGVIEDTQAVKDLRVGQRVAVYSPSGGTYAEKVVAGSDYLLPIPETMTFEEAAAFTHVFLTAHTALHVMGQAQAGESLFVTAAAGGVGGAVLQLAQRKQLFVMAGVGSDEKQGCLEKLGVTRWLNYQQESISQKVLEWTGGKGVDLILESVGGSVFEDALKCLAPMGRLLLYGMASGQAESVHPNTLLRKSATLAALNLSVLFSERPEIIRQAWKSLIQAFLSREIRPIIQHRFALEEAAAAHRLLESRQSTGKILLIP